MFYVYEKKSRNLLWSILVAILLIASVTVSLILLFENKRKKEEEELDEYLESSIQ